MVCYSLKNFISDITCIPRNDLDIRIKYLLYIDIMIEYNSKTLAYKFKNTCIPGNLYIRRVYNQNLKGYLEYLKMIQI